MPRNKIGKLTPDALLSRARVFLDVAAADPDAYPIPAETLQAIEAGLEAVEAGLTEVMDTRSEYRAAIQNRLFAEKACADALAQGARIVYASPSIPPTAIARLGLSPRSTGRRPIRPHTPDRLMLRYLRDGRILLAWDRVANDETVTFIVETQVGEGPWTFAATTSRSRRILPPSAASMATRYRVVAVKGEETSPPSPVIRF